LQNEVDCTLAMVVVGGLLARAIATMPTTRAYTPSSSSWITMMKTTKTVKTPYAVFVVCRTKQVALALV